LTLANKSAQDEIKRTLEAFSNFIKKIQAQQEAQAKENKELKDRLTKSEAALKDNKTAHDAEMKAQGVLIRKI